ncbi:hypothetical protein BD410DRAFT_748283 [Rickenella mellea]|uniref:HNH nuclease domain-containing protein n=1 Tax=Rickenella mellea TaxID=50990 RepID=A0A4Y7Q5H5_9AGAM|nr:hypothetical protein BD410DRAFT_748283 [Rickenella mellea]
MAHNRNDSLRSLTSISSRSSVETYESLKEEITAVERSQIELQELVTAAEKVVKDKLAPNPQSTYTYKKASDKISVKLDAVMSAILTHAEECGGEHGLRYVASVIVACSQKESDADVVKALAAVGTTWLTHLLFIFKTSRSHESQPNKDPHELATPTLENTASHVGGDSFQEDVLKRDGYTCVLTGFQDFSHPAPTDNTLSLGLEASHILRRSIGNFDPDHKSDSFKSAVTTFDILVNFSHLSVDKLEELHSHLDDPSNGMMLERNAHDAFDKFYWCLKQTKTNDVYTLHIYKPGGIIRKPEDNLVVFKDKSDDFKSSSTRKRSRAIPLPDPHYLAIQAAIAGILHMSGAGKFFDELLDRYKDDEGKVPPVQSWQELENLMLEGLLTESVAESFRSVKVY